MRRWARCPAASTGHAASTSLYARAPHPCGARPLMLRPGAEPARQAWWNHLQRSRGGPWVMRDRLRHGCRSRAYRGEADQREALLRAAERPKSVISGRAPEGDLGRVPQHAWPTLRPGYGALPFGPVADDRVASCSIAHVTCSRTSSEGCSDRANSASIAAPVAGPLPSATARLLSQRSWPRR